MNKVLLCTLHNMWLQLFFAKSFFFVLSTPQSGGKKLACPSCRMPLCSLMGKVTQTAWNFFVHCSQECVTSPACSSVTLQYIIIFVNVPEERAEVVVSVRGEPLLHSSRVAATWAADESWGSLGEKFAERHRSAVLIAIFTQCVSAPLIQCTDTWPRERASSGGGVGEVLKEVWVQPRFKSKRVRPQIDLRWLNHVLNIVIDAFRRILIIYRLL